jgi:hypothetical protein
MRGEARTALFVEPCKAVDDWSRMKNETVIVRDDGQIRRHHFEHTLYSGRELKDVLKATGSSRTRLYGDWDGQPHGPDAKRLIAVAQK